jgi:hypothetical protein
MVFLIYVNGKNLYRWLIYYFLYKRLLNYLINKFHYPQILKKYF